MCLKNTSVADGIQEVSKYGLKGHHKELEWILSSQGPWEVFRIEE